MPVVGWSGRRSWAWSWRPGRHGRWPWSSNWSTEPATCRWPKGSSSNVGRVRNWATAPMPLKECWPSSRSGPRGSPGREPLNENDHELLFAPAREQAALVRAGAVSPVELVEAYLARIDELNDLLGAYLTVAGD